MVLSCRHQFESLTSTSKYRPKNKDNFKAFETYEYWCLDYHTPGAQRWRSPLYSFLFINNTFWEALDCRFLLPLVCVSSPRTTPSSTSAELRIMTFYINDLSIMLWDVVEFKRVFPAYGNDASAFYTFRVLSKITVDVGKHGADT